MENVWAVSNLAITNKEAVWTCLCVVVIFCVSGVIVESAGAELFDKSKVL